MRLSVISFTENGRKLSEKIAGECKDKEISLFAKHTGRTEESREETGLAKDAGDMREDIFKIQRVDGPVAEWARLQMQEHNALVFIGACGIAVRSVAPSLKDKLHDSPVLVMDERGRYVIPVLSGHMGGANELAMFLAERTGAEPVITTATDINGRFAVDLFAKRNQLSIVNKEGIAKVSSKALAGKEITISIEPGHRDEGERLPQGVRIVPYPPRQPVDVVVTSQKDRSDRAILLRPREYVIGMGCRRGKEREQIEGFIARTLDRLGIDLTQVLALSSISQKQNERGLVEWSQKTGILFLTYKAEELQNVSGDFKSSDFVKKQVGVDNVCERAAVKACGHEARLICGKCAEDGMTIAVARKKWKVEFKEGIV